jgi:hypothetical protein
VGIREGIYVQVEKRMVAKRRVRGRRECRVEWWREKDKILQVFS